VGNSIVFEVCFRLGLDRIVVKGTTIPPKSGPAYSYFPRLAPSATKKMIHLRRLRGLKFGIFFVLVFDVLI